MCLYVKQIDFLDLYMYLCSIAANTTLHLHHLWRLLCIHQSMYICAILVFMHTYTPIVGVYIYKYPHTNRYMYVCMYTYVYTHIHTRRNDITIFICRSVRRRTHTQGNSYQPANIQQFQTIHSIFMKTTMIFVPHTHTHSTYIYTQAQTITSEYKPYIYIHIHSMC